MGSTIHYFQPHGFVELALGHNVSMTVSTTGMYDRRRGAEPDANPLGGLTPYISKDGHNIVDIRFCK